MAFPAIKPIYTYTDIDGRPLDDGYLYYGVANLDPEANPITVYWDAAETQPATQPIRTIGGYAVNAGVRAIVYAPSDYSVNVRNKNGSLVSTSASELNDSPFTFIQSGTGAVPATVEGELRSFFRPQQFGALGDNVDDSAALSATYSAASHVLIPSGNYRILSNLTISKPTTFLAGAKIIVPTGVTLTIDSELVSGSYQIFDIEAGGNVVITNGAVSEIKPFWFGLNLWFGGSNFVQGVRSGTKLLKSTGPTTANYITVVGYRALEQADTGLEGAFFGTFSGSSVTDATGNTALGYSAMRGEETPPSSGVFAAMSGTNNTAVGSGSLQNASAANRNVAMGTGALKENDSPSDNVAIGAQANRLGTVGVSNVAIGSGAAYGAGTTGVAADNQRNVLVGYNVLNAATQASYCTMVGALSGFYSSTPTFNSFFGYLTGPESATYATVSNSICIGSVARTRVDKSITIGNSITETVAGRIRIGDSTNQTSTMLGPKTLTIGDSGGASTFVITGSPEGVTTSTVGGVALRTDGGIGTTLYVKEAGSGNTGWVAQARQLTGSFTLSAAATTVVANTSTTAASKIMLTPTNAAAATLMSGAKSLYLSAKSAGVSFTFATADATAAAGTETFDYIMVN